MSADEELCYRDAVDLVGLVRQREVSAAELLEAHLARIAALNPSINAIVTLVEDRARAQARDIDARLARGEPVGALAGLPVAHKDTHLSAGIRTTFGFRGLADHVPDVDDLVVARLRSADAVTIGKTNVPEFAAGSHTFNEVFGTTRNPYDLGRSAGGSSGGAAAALAAGLHAIADGGDMGGSLRNPASFCNVVGLRPSPGRVPSWPVADGWATLSVQGPLARTVADVALVLSTLAGPDPRSPVALDEPGGIFAPPLSTRSGPGRELAGVRVAWSPDLDGSVPVDAEVVAALEPRLRVFEELGAQVEVAAPHLGGADEVFRTLRAWHFEQTLGGVLDSAPELLKPSLAANIAAGRRVTGPQLGRAQVLRTELFSRVREFFATYDVLALPVSSVLPFAADEEYPAIVGGEPQEDYLAWMRSCSAVSVVGNPALSVPAAFSPSGLPVGLQLVGRYRGERDLLRCGHAFEQATRVGRRRPPHPTGFR